MKIDNRIFLPFATPFALLFTARVIWGLAGASWDFPAVMAGLCMGLGLVGGGAAMLACFAEKVELGHTRIGGSK